MKLSFFFCSSVLSLVQKMLTMSGRLVIILLWAGGWIRQLAKYSSTPILSMFSSGFWGSGSYLGYWVEQCYESLSLTDRWWCCFSDLNKCRYFQCRYCSQLTGPWWSAGTSRFFWTEQYSNEGNIFSLTSWTCRCCCSTVSCSRSPRSGRSSRRGHPLRCWLCSSCHRLQCLQL